MKVLLVMLLIGLLGCGGNPRRSLTSSGINAGALSVTGFVSTIQVTKSATSQGANSLVTVVTFIPQIPQTSPTTTITFCGNVASDFFPNTFATVAFTQGTGCSTIVSLLPTGFVSLSGLVSIVQVVSGNGSPTTIVTFLLAGPQNGLAETLNFCGNVGNQFALNAFMTVNFTQGTGCATLVSVNTM